MIHSREKEMFLLYRYERGCVSRHASATCQWCVSDIFTRPPMSLSLCLFRRVFVALLHASVSCRPVRSHELHVLQLSKYR